MRIANRRNAICTCNDANWDYVMATADRDAAGHPLNADTQDRTDFVIEPGRFQHIATVLVSSIYT